MYPFSYPIVTASRSSFAKHGFPTAADTHQMLFQLQSMHFLHEQHRRAWNSNTRTKKVDMMVTQQPSSHFPAHSSQFFVGLATLPLRTLSTRDRSERHCHTLRTYPRRCIVPGLCSLDNSRVSITGHKSSILVFTPFSLSS